MVMEYIDIDQMYDVPDTPDRLPSNDKKNNGRVEIEINSSPPAYSKRTRIFGEGSRNQARGKSKLIIDDGLNKRLSFDPIRDPGISKGTNGNRGLKSSLTNLHPSKIANLVKKPVSSGNQLSLNIQHKEKGRENAVVDLTKTNGRAQVFELASPEENGNFISAPNSYKGKEKIDYRGSSRAYASPPPRVRGAKKLVKNGDPSPYNLANGKHIAENNSQGYVPVQNNVKSNVSDCTLDDLDLMRELVSEDNNSRTGRRQKSNLFLPKDADTTSFSSRRAHATENSTSVSDALKSFNGIGGWRNTRTIKADPPFSSKEKNINPQNERNDLRRINRIGSSPSSSTLVKKRNLGEGSSSRSPGSDTVVIGLSHKAASVRSRRNITRNGVGTSSSFIEIDELSPDMRCGDSTNRESNSNDDSYAKAMQLEADELLALELQEQMYNEMTQVGNREIDEHIALAMQEEEASEQAFARTNLPVFRPRERGPTNANRRSQLRSSQIPLTRPTTRARNSPPSRLTRLRSQVSGRSPRLPVGRRNFVFPPNMDLDTRMHILETFEAFSDMGVGSNGFQVDRDFNENDYEMLLGLDENNHCHAGASIHMINRLPQSTVQNGNTEDCAVCLETPSMGDVIRILPCFHKFHKDCIDPWLRRNTSCPVCKSSVT